MLPPPFCNNNNHEFNLCAKKYQIYFPPSPSPLIKILCKQKSQNTFLKIIFDCLRYYSVAL